LIRDVQWLASTLIFLGALLLPWAPGCFLLMAAMPVSRRTTAKDWVCTKQVQL
jgi:hypothetical protein